MMGHPLNFLSISPSVKRTESGISEAARANWPDVDWSGRTCGTVTSGIIAKLAPRIIAAVAITSGLRILARGFATWAMVKADASQEISDAMEVYPTQSRVVLTEVTQ